MAQQEKSPQVQDGHVRIANELYDAILNFGFTGRQIHVLLAIIRKTYGYRKKEDDMSASQLGSLCALPRNHVTVELNRLAELNVISKSPGVYGSIIGVNKDYSSWIDPETLKATPPKPGSVRTLDAANGKKHHYVYKVTHADTGEFYIGVRSCDCLPSQDRYRGSGNWVASVDKMRLIKEVLETFPDRSSAETAEIRFIRVAQGPMRNSTRYVSTDSVQVDSTDSVHQTQALGSQTPEQSSTDHVSPSTEPVHVQKTSFTSTDSVQVDSTDSVHTKNNLPINNQQKKTLCANADAFSRFWATYPKKKSKGQAEKAFTKINPDEQLMAEILSGVERAKKSRDWLKDRGQYIPHPATWLRARGWEDDIDSDTPNYGAQHANFGRQDYRAGVKADGSF